MRATCERAGYETHVALDGVEALETAAARGARPRRARPHAAARRRPGGDAPHPRAGGPAHARSSCSPRAARSPTASSACGSAPTTTSSSRSRRPSWSRASTRSCGASTPSAEQQAPLRFDGLVVDPGGAARAPRRRGGRAHPARVRRCCCSSPAIPGQVFTRNQLMDHVWQYSFYTDTSTVTVHIRRLRAKLEPDSGAPALDRDGVGRRLPVRGVRRLAGSLGFAIAAAGAGGGGGARSATDTTAALATLKILAPLGVRHGARRPRAGARASGGVGSLRRQFAVVAVVAMVQLTAAVVLFVDADVRLRPRRVLRRARRAYATALTAWAVHLLGRRAIDDVDAMRDDARARRRGPTRRAHRRRRTRRARPPGGRRRRHGGAARQRGAGATRPHRRRLARPAHPHHRAAAAGRRHRRRPRRRRGPPRLRGAHRHPRARPRRPDRRSLRAHPSRERRAHVDHGAGAARRPARTRRSRRCARPPTPRP